MSADGTLTRVMSGDDEMGVYEDGPDHLRVVFYDQQGDGVLLIPSGLIGPLGLALMQIAQQRAREGRPVA